MAEPSTITEPVRVAPPQRPKTGTTFEQAKEDIVSESIQRTKEVEGLDPSRAADIPRIEDITERAIARADAPRDITGEAKTAPGFFEPVADLVGDVLSIGDVFGLETSKVAEALKTKEFISAEEKTKLTDQFQNEFIPRAYDNYTRDYPDKPVEFNDFKRLMIETGGETGRAFYDVNEGYFNSIGPILQEYVLGYNPDEDSPFAGTVRERSYATGLRDLLLIETGVTAFGEEVLADYLLKYVYEPVVGKIDEVEGLRYDETFGERWAENLREARGIEELAEEYTEAGIKAGPVAVAADVAGYNIDEYAESLGDLAWYVGLGASFVLPLDLYLGALGKAAYKGTAKAGQAASKGFAKAGSEAASQAGQTNARFIIADELGLHPTDARVQLPEAAPLGPGATEAGIRIIEDAPTPEDIQRASDLGVDIADPVARQEIITESAEKLQALFPAKTVEELTTEIAAKFPEPQRAAILEQRVQLQKAIAETTAAYKNAVVRGEEIVALDKTGTPIKVEFEAASASAVRTEKEIALLAAKDLLAESIAKEITIRSTAKAIAEGRQLFENTGKLTPFGVPRGLVMLTPRVIVPQPVANLVTKEIRTSPQGILLADISKEIADTGVTSQEKLVELFSALSTRLSTSAVKILEDIPLQSLSDPAISMLDKSKILNELKAYGIEATARSVSPYRLLTMDDIERLYAGAKKTIVAPERSVPIADRIRAARNLERLKDITKPAQLKRSIFAQDLSAASNVLFPNPASLNKYFSWKGIGGGPLYDDAIKTLRNRLGNIADALDYELRQATSAAAKRGQSKLQGYADLHKKVFGDRITKAEGEPVNHFIKYLYSGYGVADDDAQILIQAGKKGSAGAQQSRSAREVAKAIAKPETEAEKAIARLVDVVEEAFPEFSDEYFEFLSGLGRVMAGLDLSSTKWVMGDDIAKHLNNLLISQRRVQIVGEFADEVTRRGPASFALRARDIETKQIPFTGPAADIDPEGAQLLFPKGFYGDVAGAGSSAAIKNVLFSKGQTITDDIVNAVQDTLTMIVSAVEKGTPEYNRLLARLQTARVTNAEEVLEAIAKARPDNTKILKAAIEDLISYKQGVQGTALADLIGELRKVVVGTEDIGTILRRVVDPASIELPHQVDSIIIDSTKAYLQNTPGANRIFEQSYLSDIGKNYASKDETVAVLENLKRSLEDVISRGDVLEDVGPVSFYQALEDLPLYVFDSKASIRADVAGLLNDRTLNVKFDYVNKAFLNSSDVEDLAARLVTSLDELPDGAEGLVKLIGEISDSIAKTPEEIATQKIFNRARGLVGGAAGTAAGLVMDIPKIAKQGVLGGFIVPNPAYHVVNNISAPALIHDTIGVAEAIHATGDLLKLPAAVLGFRSNAADVVKTIYGYSSRGDTIAVSGRADGAVYTIDDLAEIVKSNGINQSQVSVEVQRAAIEGLARWTGTNFAKVKSGLSREKIGEYFKAMFKVDRNIWNEMSVANDLYYRTGVLIRALQRGQTEGQAVQLAREAIYDYGRLTLLEQEKISKAFWIYSFWRQSIRQSIVSVVNNPRRLANNYKLGKGGYDPDQLDNELAEPFMSQYQDKRIFIDTLTDPESQQKWNYYFGDLPMLSGVDTVVSGVANFGAMAKAIAGTLTEADLTILGGQIGQLGRDYFDNAPPEVKLVMQFVVNKEFSFGEFRKEGTYVNPSYLIWAEATGNFDHAVWFFDLQPVNPPREGKPTFHGTEWKINPDNDNARKNFSYARNLFMLAGMERASREYGSMLGPALIRESGSYKPGEKETSVLPAKEYGIPQYLSAFAEGIGLYKVEEAPTTLQIQPRIERALEDEI